MTSNWKIFYHVPKIKIFQFSIVQLHIFTMAMKNVIKWFNKYMRKGWQNNAIIYNLKNIFLNTSIHTA